ncbi:hypothetical protein V5O48_004581 [Marasmius crinis-equi]|uniref:MYND-type domain-containing protein n=1 Tax=Marasmius crinis-equi TaxID=585013 RepID=A0ABR3FPT7_9AGAR
MTTHYTTAQAVTQNWSSIWPWIVAISKGIVGRPSVVFSEGVITKFLANLPTLLIYPAALPHSNPREELEFLLESTPEILAFATEMWLYTSQDAGLAGSNIAESFCNIAGVLLESHTNNQPSDFSARMLGDVAQEFQRILRDTRWDFPGILMTEIIQGLRRRRVRVATLRSRIIFLTILIKSKLSSPTYSRPTPDNFNFDDAATCVAECIKFVFLAAETDAYALIPALESGLLVSILKAKDLIIEDSKRRPSSEAGVVFVCALLFNACLERLLHRPILIRVVRSIRKVQAAGLDSDEGWNAVRALKLIWNGLRDEALRRYAALRDGGSAATDTLYPICGHSRCVNDDVRFNLNYPRFLRCTGCKSEVYCSVQCQKAAWKTHKQACNLWRSKIRAGELPRGNISGLDGAVMRYQAAVDYRSNSERINALIEQYAAEHPEDDNEGVIQMDYSRFPLEITVQSLLDSKNRIRRAMDGIKAATTGDPDDLDRGPGLALVVVPARSNGAESMPTLLIGRLGKSYMTS